MQTELAVKKLEEKQIIWETPRNITILTGALVVIFGTAAGITGYKLGQQQPVPQQVQIVFPPGTIITIPPAALPSPR